MDTQAAVHRLVTPRRPGPWPPSRTLLPGDPKDRLRRHPRALPPATAQPASWRRTSQSPSLTARVARGRPGEDVDSARGREARLSPTSRSRSCGCRRRKPFAPSPPEVPRSWDERLCAARVWGEHRRTRERQDGPDGGGDGFASWPSAMRRVQPRSLAVATPGVTPLPIVPPSLAGHRTPSPAGPERVAALVDTPDRRAR